jgi:hypothetical protein
VSYKSAVYAIVQVTCTAGVLVAVSNVVVPMARTELVAARSVVVVKESCSVVVVADAVISDCVDVDAIVVDEDAAVSSIDERTVVVADMTVVVASLAAMSVLDATVWAAMIVATLRMGTTAIPINAQYSMPAILWFGARIPIQFSIMQFLNINSTVDKPTMPLGTVSSSEKCGDTLHFTMKVSAEPLNFKCGNSFAIVCLLIPELNFIFS